MPAAHAPRRIETPAGPLLLRPETPADEAFLFALFRSHAGPGLALMPLDEAGREAILRMQFQGQAQTYRAQFPDARFDILEREGVPLGRLVLADSPAGSRIVDIALLPERQGQGLGSAVLRAVLAGATGPVRCQVLADNLASRRMVERVGFVAESLAPPFVRYAWAPCEKAGTACP